MKREVARERFERALVGFGLVSPTATAPQLYKIWVLKHAAGLSAVTLSAALFMSLMWTTYGVLEGRKALWGINAMWVALNGVTLAGVLVYG
ncbi:MAG: hypothetical protein IBX62_08860 [Coriobacteriia bacterium]|nr:hypothetical protein [Coriobacteriia bacterium]